MTGLNRYIVEVGVDGMTLIHASSWSGSPQEIDGQTLIPIAANDERQAITVAKALLAGRANELSTIEIAGFTYYRH